MRRYGMDIIHKWLTSDRLSLTTKIYASDFERDWWRQITTKVRASELQTYLGDEIFANRYSYLSGRTFGEEDYVIVGRLSGGLEGTTDSRWMYQVSGLKETQEHQWEAFGRPGELEVGLNLHRKHSRMNSFRTTIPDGPGRGRPLWTSGIGCGRPTPN